MHIPYPENTAIKIPSCLINPLPNLFMIIAIASVINATKYCSDAILKAVCSKFKPITTIIDPVT